MVYTRFYNMGISLFTEDGIIELRTDKKNLTCDNFDLDFLWN
jgi:hypothetical protein